MSSRRQNASVTSAEFRQLSVSDRTTEPTARNKPFDDPAHSTREEAIVANIVKQGKSAMLILGGDHDLTDAIKVHPGWGYVRVTPKGFPE